MLRRAHCALWCMPGFEFVLCWIVLCFDVPDVLHDSRCVVVCCVIFVPYAVLLRYLFTELKNQSFEKPCYVVTCVLRVVLCVMLCCCASRVACCAPLPVEGWCCLVLSMPRINRKFIRTDTTITRSATNEAITCKMKHKTKHNTKHKTTQKHNKWHDNQAR